MVRRRPAAARLLIGGRNLAGAERSGGAISRCRSTASLFQEWDASPGFFLQVFDIPAGRLAGQGTWATLTVQSTPSGRSRRRSSNSTSRTSSRRCGATTRAGRRRNTAWPWASGAGRAIVQRLRIAGPPRAVRVTLTIESPLRYFDARANGARACRRAGTAASTTSPIRANGPLTCRPTRFRPSGGAITIETDKTFVPAERGSAPDRRRLGTARVCNSCL